ncbi:hypothetical protein SGLAM104S_08754 [Streptomyces glaucescens]
MSSNVRSSATTSGSTSSDTGYASCNSPRICTRLIESIPRSASTSIPGSSISTG